MISEEETHTLQKVIDFQLTTFATFTANQTKPHLDLFLDMWPELRIYFMVLVVHKLTCYQIIPPASG